jgi:intracellular multiplication protein IcmW
MGYGLEEIHKFWHSYEDPNLIKIILFMESNEEWTLDGDEDFESTIEQLSGVFKKTSEVKNTDKLIKLLSLMKMGRILYILQDLDSNHPGEASKLLMHAEKIKSTDNYADLFVRRNIIFERLRLVSRIFHPERMNILQQSLES